MILPNFLNKAVAIEWIDSQTGGDPWTPHEEVYEWAKGERELFISIGIFIERTSDHITICLSDNHEEFGPYTRIPMMAVKKIWQFSVEKNEWLLDQDFSDELNEE